jgi:RNA polymerase sigma-70 factor (ECF subfamily)
LLEEQPLSAGFIPDYKKADDETLLSWIANAEENALGELYDRYGRLVFSMALNAVSDPAVAEEITQDVYLRIWNKAESYRPEQGKVITWIASITRYRAIDLLRRQSVRPEGNRAAWAEEEPMELSDSVDIEGEVEVNQRAHLIRMAIIRLPDEQRLALALAYFQGYSHSEISSLLGEPLGTVKTRIRLAMQKLRQVLYEAMQSDEI